MAPLKELRMRSLRYLNTILTVLAVLLVAQLWTTWMTPHPAGADTGVATPAWAQSRGAGSGGGIPDSGGGIPDAGAQRKEMIDLLKKQCVQNEELAGLLRSGEMRVRVEQTPGDKQ
jgi:hypothetical protein